MLLYKTVFYCFSVVTKPFSEITWLSYSRAIERQLFLSKKYILLVLPSFIRYYLSLECLKVNVKSRHKEPSGFSFRYLFFFFIILHLFFELLKFNWFQFFSFPFCDEINKSFSSQLSVDYGCLITLSKAFKLVEWHKYQLLKHICHSTLQHFKAFFMK